MSNLDFLQQRYCRHADDPRTPPGGCLGCAADTYVIERTNALPPDDSIQLMLGQRLKRLPWALIRDHEKQAKINHGQTLIYMHHRAGLTPAEALSIIADTHWREANRDELAAELKLIDLLMS